MSKDKACMSAVKEVCRRCHLYKENCGMLDYPEQCRTSGRYIDGYRQAEKDNELTWEDIHTIAIIEDKLIHELCLDDQTLPHTKEFFQKVLKRFKEGKEKTNGE